MLITKTCLPRRTFLQGLGAAVALPLLDGMFPALTATANAAANPALRLGVWYVPNGVAIWDWTPKENGSTYEFTPIL